MSLNVFPDSKVFGANMGPIWGRQYPGGPHVGPMNMNFAIWVGIFWVEFQRIPLKCHTKYLTHTLKDMILYTVENVRIHRFEGSYAFLKRPPRFPIYKRQTPHNYPSWQAMGCLFWYSWRKLSMLLWNLTVLLWPSDAIWRHRSVSALVQVMVWCHKVTSHYMDQNWLDLVQVMVWCHKVTSHYMDQNWLDLVQVMVWCHKVTSHYLDQSWLDLVQVMVWCHKVTSHYLDQSWLDLVQVMVCYHKVQAITRTKVDLIWFR